MHMPFEISKIRRKDNRNITHSPCAAYFVCLFLLSTESMLFFAGGRKGKKNVSLNLLRLYRFEHDCSQPSLVSAGRKASSLSHYHPTPPKPATRGIHLFSRMKHTCSHLTQSCTGACKTCTFPRSCAPFLGQSGLGPLQIQFLSVRKQFCYLSQFI